MRDLGLTIDRSQEFDNGPIKGTDPDYLDYCHDELVRSAQSQQEKWPHQEPQIWSPAMMTTAANFVKDRGFELHIIPALNENGQGGQPLSSCGHAINMGLAAIRIYETQRNFERGLRHEAGHIADNESLATKFPDLAPLLSCAPMDPAGTRTIIKKLLEIFMEALPAKEAAEFKGLVRDVIGDLEIVPLESLSGIASILFEALRYGEEAYVQEIKDHDFWPEYHQFKKGGENLKKNHPLLKELQIARMQEAGNWAQFKKEPSFDPKSVQDINKKAVRFFRMAIKASHRFLQQ